MRGQIGEMDDRIQIEQESRVADGMGGYELTWTVRHGPMWAAVRPMSGRERQFADQVRAESGYVVIIRNREVFEGDRIKWINGGNRLLNIRAVHRKPRSNYLKMEADMGVAQ
jgi:SPP1 family predicted phage head-tail adaptor